MTRPKIVLISLGILFVGVGSLVSWIGGVHSDPGMTLSGIIAALSGGILIGVNL
jgi:hypothetical protein